MTRNLWIGLPGRLHEIDRAAKSFDRTADLGVSEFRSLGGRVTVQSTPRANRRVKLSWEMLEPEHSRFLDRLARRVDGVGPLAFIDPAAVNMLGPAQAAGLPLPGESFADHWFSVTPAIPYTVSSELGYWVTTTSKDLRFGWYHGYWYGFPVVPGLRVSFRLPYTWGADTAVAQLDFKTEGGDVITSATGAGGLVTATAPSGAAFVTPVGGPGAAGTFPMADSCLTYGDPAERGVPGDGCPPVAITAYNDAPAQPLPYRNVSVDLVEVSRAAG